MVTNRNTDHETRAPSRGTMSDYQMSALEVAAQTSDERAFDCAMAAIDWRARSAEDLMRAIQLALEAGTFGSAREISSL